MNAKIHLHNAPVVICDLDGTIALDEERADKCLRQGKKDWDAYYDLCHTDKPCAAVITILRQFAYDHDIYILSGRIYRTLEATTTWLWEHGVPYNYLQLRGTDDRTQDTELKLRWAKELGLQERTLFVLEDRARMVKAWRDAGYTVLQVAEGNF